MNIVIRRTVAAVAAFGLATLLAGCTSPGASSASASAAHDSGTLRVAYLDTANYMTTMQDTQSLQKRVKKLGGTVEYSKMTIPADGITAVESGHADVTTTGTGYFVNLIGERKPWVAYALEKYTGDSQGIVAAPGSGIRTLKDLYGKTLAIDRKGATGDYIIHQAFAHAGLDLSKVNVTYLSPTDFASAFRGGKIDALATFDQNLAMALATPGAREIVNGTQIGSVNWTIHVASKQFAQQHPELLKAAYQGLRAEAARAKKNPSVITDAYKKLGAPADIIAKIKTFSIPTIEPMDAIAVANLKKQAQQYQDFGFISSVPDFTGTVFDASK